MKGGLPCAEVTFRTDAAEESIRIMTREYPDMLVGAGTVLTVEQVDKAVNAGAKFIVSPGFDTEIVDYCMENEIPVFPGCVTPSEVAQAVKRGLHVVKFFPEEQFGGVNTIKALAAPYTTIKFMPTGGVNASTDMEAFPSAKHLCSWAGLTPTNNESAGKKKSVRVSRAGCYIKPLLVQCANAVVKSNKHPEIRNRYLRLKKRRDHRKAIIAIARMLLTALYHMLKNGENYNAELYRKSGLPSADREITVEQAIIIARNQGYKIKSATA